MFTYTMGMLSWCLFPKLELYILKNVMTQQTIQLIAVVLNMMEETT